MLARLDTVQEPRSLRSAHHARPPERPFEAFFGDKDVVRPFAMIRPMLEHRGRKPRIMDAWIAARPVPPDLTVYSQDADFDDLADARVLRVLRRVSAGDGELWAVRPPAISSMDYSRVICPCLMV